MRTFFLVGLMFFSLLVPAVSLAASTDLAPEFNPLCWHKDDCEKTRAELLQKELKDVKLDTTGWLKEEPCNQEGWGKCLPSGITVTEIAFGGQKKFANLGEFLKTNYNLALALAGILAVMMIIIAGVQWVTSGGNSEMITSAKKRIGGALTGLLIAYLSYTILNTINPALVNLRLPQNFMLRPFKITPQDCKDAAAGTKFALAAKSGEVVDKTKMQDPKLVMEALTADKMGCGDNFFLEGGGGSTCMGGSCSEKGKTCLPFTLNGSEIVKKPSCQSWQLAIHYSMDTGVVGLLNNLSWFTAKVGDKDWLDDDVFSIRPVCQRGSIYYVTVQNEEWANEDANNFKIVPVSKSPFFEYYVLFNGLDPASSPAYPITHWACLPGDQLAGFVVKSELDKASWWGGSDANFYVGGKYTGPWYSISKNGFVSTSSLPGGVLINAVLGNDAVEFMVKKTGQSPGLSTVDGAVDGDMITAEGIKSKEQVDKEVDAAINKAKWESKAGI